MVQKEPLVVSDKNEMRKWSTLMRSEGNIIALVPTMGFLHQGHLSLIAEARNHANVVAVSIYANPGQYSSSEEITSSPHDFDGDIQKLMSVPGGVDVVFHPHNLYDYGNYEDKNGDFVEKGIGSGGVLSCIDKSGFGYETWVRVEKLEKKLCGKSRPIFFRGVATVVTKLFNLVNPHVAVFGKKDYQQWRIIHRLVRDLDFSIQVIGCEVVRDSDGLALSSRNVNLSPENREKALSINKSLLRVKSAVEDGQKHSEELKNLVIQGITEADGRVDYAEIVDQKNLDKVELIKGPVVCCVAAWFGKVRLIDNIEINF